MSRKLSLYVAVSILLLSSIAPAQIDPGNHDIFQNRIKVGEIYVPPHAPGQLLYVEHWVLFPGYVYPGPENMQKLQIRPAPLRYSNEAEFFRNVPWGRGYRYVHVTAYDTNMLPGR
jgi:hypothetical protein